MSRLVVVGLGYVGLPTAALFASGGVDVVGVDTNDDAVRTINSGQVHIVEPGLEEVVDSVVRSGSLVAQSECVPADVYVIAVPTPLRVDRRPDLSYVESAARSIGPHLRSGALVLLESTSPIGATEQLASWLSEVRPDLSVASPGGEVSDISLAYCPERVLPGNVLHELVHNDRLIGGLTPDCAAKAAAFYRIVVEGDCVLTDSRTAEMAKLTENAYRDVNIAFANELSVIAHEVGVDVRELIDLANRHPRVNVLRPGPGVGGHCIAVDPWFLVEASEHARLIRTARTVNDYKPKWVVDRVVEAIDANDARTVACLGLSYKPDIDDFRESPAIEVVRLLADTTDAELLVVEPNVDVLPAELGEVAAELCTFDDAIMRADVVVGLVAHQQIVERVDTLAADAVCVDPAGIFGPGEG